MLSGTSVVVLALKHGFLDPVESRELMPGRQDRAVPLYPLQIEVTWPSSQAPAFELDLI